MEAPCQHYSGTMGELLLHYRGTIGCLKKPYRECQKFDTRDKGDLRIMKFLGFYTLGPSRFSESYSFINPFHLLSLVCQTW